MWISQRKWLSLSPLRRISEKVTHLPLGPWLLVLPEVHSINLTDVTHSRWPMESNTRSQQRVRENSRARHSSQVWDYRRREVESTESDPEQSRVSRSFTGQSLDINCFIKEVRKGFFFWFSPTAKRHVTWYLRLHWFRWERNPLFWWNFGECPINLDVSTALADSNVMDDVGKSDAVCASLARFRKKAISISRYFLFRRRCFK
jgi:hypothetical protein